MRTLLLLPLLVLFVPPAQTPPPQQDSSITVLSFKWSKARQVVEKLEEANPGPVRAVIPDNKIYARNARQVYPGGARDPNEDTVDERSAALEKSVQESRTPQSKPVDGYAYRVKFQNGSTKVIDLLFWEYQFIDSADPNNVTSRQFLCDITIKPGKEMEVHAFSLAGPSNVVSVDSLGKQQGNPFLEKVVINRVAFADGSTWQRKDWKAAEIKNSYLRAIRTPWGNELCRVL